MSAASLTRILLIEDDQAYVRLLSEMFVGAADTRYAITAVASLDDALERLGQDPGFDVALVDLGLPDADGMEVIEKLRMRAPRCPIVVLSGRDDVEVAIACMRHGAQEYLVKGQGERHLLPRAIRYSSERMRMREFEQLLLGVVSHDLRGPLQTIGLACELMRDSVDDDASLSVLGRMERAVHRATALVSDLLDATRIGLSGVLPIEPHPADVVRLIHQAVDDARLAHPGRKFEVHTPASARVRVDPHRISQVFANLIGNAVQHSPASAIVSVSLSTDANLAVFEVHNAGPPIAADVRPRLFEPLERASRPGRRSGSIGLGLYIVREIVRAHQGHIDVASTAEDGTTFRVKLAADA